MKYLKMFNESVEFSNIDLDDLKFFCEEHLIDLMDVGFGIRVRHGSNKTRARVEFYKDDYLHPIPFEWDDVKNNYIPFYEMLCNNYNVDVLLDRTANDVRECPVKFDYRKPAKQLWETESKWFTNDEIVNDEINEFGNYVGVISIFLNYNKKIPPKWD